MHVLDFEKSIVELETKLQELKRLTSDGSFNVSNEITNLEKNISKQLTYTYNRLTPWQKVQVARHPNRPQCSDYIKGLMEDFTPLAGDRNFGEDAAMLGGLARFKGTPIMVMGQEKGHDTTSRVKHNFGMPKPEGYRKAARLMQMADQFELPIITFINTPGAYPGVEAEERGQSEAIARAIDVSLQVKVPVVSVIIGEGGSGGAIAIAVANEICMLEHSIYSVISPEGCASILWKDAAKREDAATALKLTAQDLKDLKIIDHIIPEKLGAAHRYAEEAISATGHAIESALSRLLKLSPKDLLKQRREKFAAMGYAQNLIAK